MSVRDPHTVLLEVFNHLRDSGFSLGMGELLVALKAVDGGWGTDDPEALREVARLLWCHSRQEIAEFEEIYSAVLAASTPATDLSETAGPVKLPHSLPEDRLPKPSLPSENPTGPPEASMQLSVLPVRTPFQPPPSEGTAELRAYWPVSRRSMVYTWRYLRRPVKDGPLDVLNVAATVEQTARQGFFLHPVYERRETNHAHLILMIDQGGSMVPFHRFTRDLVETACEESTLQQVDAVYFHNVLPASVYRDPHLMESLPLEAALAECSPDTSVLLVSDAGAARGYRRMDRIRATTEFLVRLKRLTTLLAWLNPMPQPRWAGTSAQFIARLVPMFPMDSDGFCNAVDVLRGQPLYPHR